MRRAHADEAPWRGPDVCTVGGPVYAQPVLVRTEALMVVARSVIVYPNGLSFAIHTVFHAGVRARGGPWDAAWGAPEPPTGMRVSVLLADGARVRPRGGVPPGAPPPRPLLSLRRGEGGRGAWEQEYWLWPGPPAGDVGVAVEWSDLGIPDSIGVVTARQLEDGRARIIA